MASSSSTASNWGADATGVRNRMMLAAPAMPNARTSVVPMMNMISAPETHGNTCA
jgi:hypothetical protein